MEHTEKAPNGVDLEALIGTVAAVKAAPSLARFRFRVHNRWVAGAHSKTTIQGFYGTGKEDASRKNPFVLEGDEPPVLLGGDAGPNAVEAVLHALASCLVVGFVYNATARGIGVDSMELDLEGDLDLQGFLGLSKNVRPGYEGIRVICRVKSSATDEALQDLWAYSQEISPVMDIVRNPVPVFSELKKA